MMDREKVIKGLEKLRKDLGYGLPDRSNVVVEYLNSLTDAIELLKEQEAVVPVYTTISHPFHIGILYRCGNCHHSLTRDEDLFCRHCGKPIDWTKKAVKWE